MSVTFASEADSHREADAPTPHGEVSDKGRRTASTPAPLTRATDVWIYWTPMVVLPVVFTAAWPSTWPAWGQAWGMWALICACFKWITWQDVRRVDAPLWKRIGYAVAWPGHDPIEFLQKSPEPAVRSPHWTEWLAAVAKPAFGAGILWGGAIAIPARDVQTRAWVGSIGIMLILYFGVYHIASCAWRTLGVRADPMMDRPLFATSVASFWNRRWNRAFYVLSDRYLFRKLPARWGVAAAVGVVFVFSAVLHELSLSAPVHAGYGLPTLYLSLQPLGIVFERSRAGRRLGLGRGPRGWLFAMLVCLVPLPLLAHRPFLRGVVAPFLDALAALPPR